MTPAALDTVRRRCEAATPPPWVWDDGDYVLLSTAHDPDRGYPDGFDSLIVHAHDPRYSHDSTLDGKPSIQNRAFLAAAREDVPALLAEVERLRALCRRAGADPDAGG